MGYLTENKKPGQGYDEVPQHPLERLYALRVDTELRRKTFSDWPKGNKISPDELCDNGFYYMGTQDKVQCAFCGGVLSGWSEDDDVSKEHARHFGQCELVRLRNRLSTNCESSKQPLQVIKDNSSNSRVKPYKRQFGLYSDRLSTFNLWPKSLKQTPEDLAATGLYYTGTGDKCQCYMCGGILCDWESEDIPKEEHRRWFPKCPLIKT